MTDTPAAPTTTPGPADATLAPPPPAAFPGPTLPPGPGFPYGAIPYPYNAAAAKTNGMAVAALIMGICGFLFLPACVGIGLGFGALGTIGRTRQPGRGIAIAGIVLSGVWLVLWVLLFVLS